jgi:hypothetical protein
MAVRKTKWEIKYLGVVHRTTSASSSSRISASLASSSAAAVGKSKSIKHE